MAKSPNHFAGGFGRNLTPPPTPSPRQSGERAGERGFEFKNVPPLPTPLLPWGRRGRKMAGVSSCARRVSRAPPGASPSFQIRIQTLPGSLIIPDLDLRIFSGWDFGLRTSGMILPTSPGNRCFRWQGAVKLLHNQMDAASLGLAIRDCKERGFDRLTYAP